MRLLVLFCFLFFACNQSEDKSDAGKNMTPADTVRTDTVKPDTTRLNKLDTTKLNKASAAADTTTKKTEKPVRENLQNFWALETVDGKPLAPKDFPGGTPYLQLSLTKNTVSGYAGCNSIKGSIKVEGATITFGELATTKSTCGMQEFENNYLNSLSGHKVHYALQVGRLVLTTEQNKVFIYHKMQ